MADRVQAHSEVRCELFEQQIGLLLDHRGQFVAAELAAGRGAGFAALMLATLSDPEKHGAQVNFKTARGFGFAASACHETQDPLA